MTASIPATLQGRREEMKVLAVTGTKRIPQRRRAELAGGSVLNANVINYWGIVAPAGTHAAIVARLNAETRKVLAQPRCANGSNARRRNRLGPTGTTRHSIETDLASWKKLIVDPKIMLE